MSLYVSPLSPQINLLTLTSYLDFDTRQQATEDAGTVTDLQDRHIINEPTAYAIAYQSSNKRGDS
jgi:molecular chaperone DnaK (HSP70)